MLKPALPANEPERLEELRSYEILDTPDESDYGDITLLAAQICQTPMALISLVDADRQWFKARFGVETRQTPRDISFCAHAILERDLMIVPDASEDHRFRDNPLVTTEPKLRFYAGAPLVTPRGLALGTLCVVDHVKRELTPNQKVSLAALARHVTSLLHHRRHTFELEAAVAERDNRIAELLNGQRARTR